ncbi:MAG: DNA repair protein RecO [Cruoricaptor ignavus]|nr:DNA repair protein RecO [Cruoricaptor ignavus]MDO5617132.1 DNA repair protein RecO [Cruoricaptor ignavus]
MNSEQGFILSYLKYGDSNAVVHCFTQENGYESFFVKGIYSPKNKKKAYLQPLNEICFTTNRKNTGSLKNISQMELSYNSDFRNNVKINTIIFFVADFLNHILKNENYNPQIYDEIEILKNEIKKDNYQCHLIFVFNLLKINGLSPLLTPFRFLNPETGNFSKEQTHHLFNEEISSIWQELISAENTYEITIESVLRKDFLDSLLVYYHYHYADFRTPDSLEIVQQIFG